MKSRDKILNAINHKESELPLDLGATPSSGISAIGYNKLKKALNIEGGHTRIYDVVQQVAQIEDSVIDTLGVDVIDIGRAFNTDDKDWYDVTLADGSTGQYPHWFKPKKEGENYSVYHENGQKIASMPSGATFFDQTVFPYVNDYPNNYKNLSSSMDLVLWQKLGHSPWDNAAKPNFYEELRKKALFLRQNTDKALMIVCGCNLFEWGTFLRRMDNFLMDIYTDEDLVEGLLDALMEKHLATLKNVCDSVGDVVDILRFGDDLGMDTGMFMSKQKYQDLFKPRHTMLNEYVHKHSKMKTLLHSCGSVYPIIDDLIEAGYDILNPVQTTARQMDPIDLKKNFGKDIVFWGGGCNTRSILNRATPKEVYNYSRKMIDIFSDGGGFVFNQEHNIMPDVPSENMLAMFKAVNDSRTKTF